MRPRREAGRVRADTAPRRSEQRRGDRGRGGRLLRGRSRSRLWCGDENGSKGGAVSGTGNREDAFGSPQSEKDGPADAAAEAF